jgi:3D (Asp-Asp-Asp) domain-containing protein
LPFGTRVYIPALGATFVVQDRGGSISDYHIDIYFATEAECLSFGRQDLEIIILD